MAMNKTGRSSFSIVSRKLISGWLESRGQSRKAPNPPAGPTPTRYSLELLEPRILLNADPLPVLPLEDLTASMEIEPSSEMAITHSLESPLPVPIFTGSLDVDNNSLATQEDGLIILHYLFGLRGEALTTGLVDLQQGQRTDPQQIVDFLDSLQTSMLDVDADEAANPMTDAQLILRFLQELTGTDLTAGVVNPSGARTNAADVQAFLSRYLPESIPPVLTATLASDTGVENTDTLTFDPTIIGTLNDNVGISFFKAGFDATAEPDFVDILNAFDPNTAAFTLTSADFMTIQGSPLSEGAHTLHLFAEDPSGNQTTLDVAFILDTIHPTVVTAPTGNFTETFSVFEVVFSERMGPNAFEVGSYELLVSGGPNDGLVVTLQSVEQIDDRTVRITVPKALHEETYHLNLDPTLIDWAGNTLADPLAVEFTLVHTPTVIQWTNPAGGFWDVAGNWDLGRVPELTDDVVIDSTGAFTVTHRTGSTEVHSLTLRNDLTLAVLTGSSIKAHNEAFLAGILNADGGDFTAIGPVVTFEGDRARVFASNGAHVILCAPDYSSAGLKENATVFSATGIGTLLDLSFLTALHTGYTDQNSTLATSHTISVTNGGRLNLGSVVNVTAPVLNDDSVRFVVDGATSSLDLSSLTTIDPTGGYTQFSLTNGATVDLPAIQTLGDVALNLASGSHLTANGAQPVTYSTTGLDNAVGIQATGAGTVLDLSAVTSVAVSTTGNPNGILVTALDGGEIDLSGSTSITVPETGINGFIRITADGVGSLVSLDDLTLFADTGPLTPSQLEVKNGGMIHMPNLPVLDGINVTIGPLGSMQTTQLTTITNATVSVNGGTVLFPNVTTLDGTSVFVSGGVTLAFPALISVTQTAPGDRTWQASGAGSVLNLATLTNLTGATAGGVGLLINAINGGQVDVSSTTAMTVPGVTGTDINGVIEIIADGVGSVVTLNSLTDFTDVGVLTPSRLEVKNGGSILIPNLSTLNGIDVIVGATGTIDVAQLTAITKATISVSGATALFPNVSTLDGTSVLVSGGVTLAFPALTSFSQTATQSRTWQASGAGSVLDLSGLTSLTGSVAAAAAFNITTLNGGQVDLGSLTTINVPGTSITGRIFFKADGNGSLVDLSNLTNFTGAAVLTPSRLEVGNGGDLNIPNLTILDGIDLLLGTTGTIDTAQLTGITNATVTINGGTHLFSTVTTLDGTSVLVNGGATAAFPGVTSYMVISPRDITWRATGAGSQLVLDNVVTITGSAATGRDLFIEGITGGHVDIRGVTTLTVPGTGFNGTIQVLADGSNSVVDLTSATSFIDNGANTLSKLEQRNSGDIIAPDLTTLVNVTVIGGPLSAGSSSLGTASALTEDSTTTATTPLLAPASGNNDTIPTPFKDKDQRLIIQELTTQPSRDRGSATAADHASSLHVPAFDRIKEQAALASSLISKAEGSQKSPTYFMRQNRGFDRWPLAPQKEQPPKMVLAPSPLWLEAFLLGQETEPAIRVTL